MPKLSIGLTDDQIRSIVQVLQENERLSRVILYGSRAKGNFNPGSDIDLAIVGDTLDLKDIVNFRIKLDNLPILQKIDLLIYDKINESALLEHIDRVGIVIFERITG